MFKFLILVFFHLLIVSHVIFNLDACKPKSSMAILVLNLGLPKNDKTIR